MKSASYMSEVSQAGLGVPTLPISARFPSRISDFVQLTKPRMNMLVVATTFVGFYMALRTQMPWMLLLETIIGTTLTAAAASVLNQHIERNHDALMARTADRPAAAGRIRPPESLLFGCALAISGLTCLLLLVNPLTAAIGALTLFSYVLIYTPLKRYTTLCTVIGAIPGALPPVMGWTALRNEVSPEAWVLFGILFLWQMPHFLAIATMYREDYAAGGFRMLPVVDENLASTSRQIILYTVALIAVSVVPSAMPMAGAIYLVGALMLGIAFLTRGIIFALHRNRPDCHRPDARRLFLASIIYLPVLLALLMLDRKH